MLEEIFSTGDLVDNLRIIYKSKSSKETYELIKISNEYGEEVMMPLSKRTLYDLYILIDKQLKRVFESELDKDYEKRQKFTEMKLHDKFIEKLIELNLKKTKNEFDKLRSAIQDGFLFNRKLMEEFEVHKIKNLIEDTIGEEIGLLDNYYIGNYLSMYHDVDIDFESILINSINTYTELVSEQTKAHYPKISDYGTAQDYFYKVRSRTFSDQPKDKCSLGRLYYRDILNKNMLKFVKENCKKMIHRGVLIQVCAITVSILMTIFEPQIIPLIVGFVSCITTINILFKVRESSVISRRFKENISYEETALELLATTENSNIKRWYVM